MRVITFRSKWKWINAWSAYCPGVQKPARYTGGEYNEIIKDKADVKLRMAFCFPDVYEIGMSNLGMQHTLRLHKRRAGHLVRAGVRRPGATWRRRCARTGIPLYALESGDPVWETSTSSASRSATRWPTARCWTCWTWRDPLCARADRPEPCAARVRGRDKLLQPGAHGARSSTSWCSARARRWTSRSCASSRRPRDEGWEKRRFLIEAANIQGVYVPALYEPECNADGTLGALTPMDGRAGEA